MRGTGRWPNGARAAISVTLDNLGEAADVQRGLWPGSAPVGRHFTATETGPAMLALLRRLAVPATYFIETWSLGVYADFVRAQVVGGGVEMGWHAWQHEAWAKLTEEAEERNFRRSFGPEEGVLRWLAEGEGEKGEGEKGEGEGEKGKGKKGEKAKGYSGFRPPGGIVRPGTVGKCLRYGLRYLSPAGERAAVVREGVVREGVVREGVVREGVMRESDGDGEGEGEGDSNSEGEGERELVVLPFKWACVDAYFYMDTFAGLRRLKGEYGDEAQSPETLVERYLREIDAAIDEGGFLAPLFHPFLTTTPARLRALETVLDYLVQKRAEGLVWLATCRDVAEFVRHNRRDLVGTDPGWDLSSWR